MRNSTTSSPKAGVKRTRLLHWKRTLSWRVLHSSAREGAVTSSAPSAAVATAPPLPISPAGLLERRHRARAELVGDKALHLAHRLGPGRARVLGDRPARLLDPLHPDRVVGARGELGRPRQQLAEVLVEGRGEVGVERD